MHKIKSTAFIKLSQGFLILVFQKQKKFALSGFIYLNTMPFLTRKLKFGNSLLYFKVLPFIGQKCV